MLHSSLEEANKEVAIEVRWKAFELRPQEMRAEVDDSWFAEKKKQIEAYWLRQEDISHPGVLTAIAVGLGLDETAFTADLADETLRDEVLTEERMAQQLGIRGVPATIIDERYLLSGAQPAARLIALLSEYAQTGTMNGR